MRSQPCLEPGPTEGDGTLAPAPGAHAGPPGSRAAERGPRHLPGVLCLASVCKDCGELSWGGGADGGPWAVTGLTCQREATLHLTQDHLQVIKGIIYE